MNEARDGNLGNDLLPLVWVPESNKLFFGVDIFFFGRVGIGAGAGALHGGKPVL